MQIEDLERFNPWWKTGHVKEGWLREYRRKTYFDIAKYLDRRQIILIWGLRRVGKSTLMLIIHFRLSFSLITKKFQGKPCREDTGFPVKTALI